MTRSGTVVVTGASTGIGRATALHLDGLGYEVLAGVRRDQDGDALRAAGSERLKALTLDVTEPASIEQAAKTVGQTPLAGLVNNAGIAIGGPLEYVQLDAVRRQFEVNVLGVLAVTQAFMPALRRGTGRVITVGSVGGRVSSPFVGPYSASKYAVEALTDALRQELRPWGMHVIVVEPGAVTTPIWGKGAEQVDDLAGSLDSEAQERYGPAMSSFGALMDKLDRRGIAPEKVARVVARALTAARPRTRYLVGPDARAQLALKTVLPDRVMDALTARFLGV